jgi:tRNA-dihydrouridine synthase 1
LGENKQANKQANKQTIVVRLLYKNLKIPIFCKIRIWTDFDRTLSFAKMLEKAGCSLLTIHGRTKEQKWPKKARADWETIR